MALDDTHYDDYEWPERKVEATRQVVFGWNGHVYEMTLCGVNVDLFNAAVAPWAERARKVGLKVPPLPKDLRVEFPTAGVDPDGSEVAPATPAPPPVTEKPAPQVTKKKAAPPATTPLFAAAEEDEKSASPSDISELPERWWEIPKDAPYRTQQAFKAARTQMWTLAGYKKPMRGRVPEEVAAAWAREHPVRAWKLAAMNPSRPSET